MRALPWSARIYICSITLVALVILVQVPSRTLHWPTVAVFVALILAAESGANLPSRHGMRLSAGFSVTLAAAVIVGPVGAALVGSAGALAYYRDGLPVVKRVFNGAVYAISTFSAAYVFHTLAPGAPGPLAAGDFPRVLLPFVAALGTHLLVNVPSLAAILGLTQGRHSLREWSSGLLSWVPPYVGYGIVGLVAAALWADIGALSVPLVLIPLVVGRWVLGQHAAEQTAYDATIAALCKALETKDLYTRGHCERVAKASVLIARQLGMREGRVRNLHYAGMMHDVGKLGVPTQVLQKAGSLTEDEFAAIRLHPTRGAEIVGEIEFLDEAQAGIVHHHERLDGRGYPSGLAGTDIPEFARVIGVADAFDCMTSTRSYRSARSPASAIGELRRHAGTQFDPKMVGALVEAVDEHGWQPHVPDVPSDYDVTASAWRDHDDPGAPLPAGGGG